MLNRREMSGLGRGGGVRDWMVYIDVTFFCILIKRLQFLLRMGPGHMA